MENQDLQLSTAELQQLNSNLSRLLEDIKHDEVLCNDLVNLPDTVLATYKIKINPKFKVRFVAHLDKSYKPADNEIIFDISAIKQYGQKVGDKALDEVNGGGLIGGIAGFIAGGGIGHVSTSGKGKANQKGVTMMGAIAGCLTGLFFTLL